MNLRFRDRSEAGKLLAERLQTYRDREDVLILALPRGGVVVGFEVAHQLSLPLDVLMVRKLGVPEHEELAMGAIATGGVKLLNHSLIRMLGLSDEAVRLVELREGIELARREREYRGDHLLCEVAEKTVILVDDGIATGSTMQVAIRSLRQRGVRHLIVAVPVVPKSVVASLHARVDEIVSLITPENFGGVGFWYDDFSQTGDEEVRRLLNASAHLPIPFQ